MVNTKKKKKHISDNTSTGKYIFLAFSFFTWRFACWFDVSGPVSGLFWFCSLGPLLPAVFGSAPLLHRSSLLLSTHCQGCPPGGCHLPVLFLSAWISTKSHTLKKSKKTPQICDKDLTATATTICMV